MSNSLFGLLQYRQTKIRRITDTEMETDSLRETNEITQDFKTTLFIKNILFFTIRQNTFVRNEVQIELWN